MRRPFLLRSLAAAAVSTMFFGVAACSDDAEKNSDTSSVAGDGGSGSVDQSEEGEVLDNAEFVALMRSGLETSTTAQMTMSMDFGGGGLEMSGQVDYTTEPVSLAMEMTQAAMGDQPIEMVMVDGVMYMNMGSMTNGKFVEFDLSDPESLPPGLGDLGEQLDPLAAFKEFEPALEKVTFVGSEDVAGEELEHYEVVLDSAEIDALDEIPTDAEVPETVTYDIWFDDQMRMRQMEMLMDMATPVTIEAKLFDWDEPVDITAPAADEIAEQPTA